MRLYIADISPQRIAFITAAAIQRHFASDNILINIKHYITATSLLCFISTALALSLFSFNFVYLLFNNNNIIAINSLFAGVWHSTGISSHMPPINRVAPACVSIPGPGSL